MAPRERGEGKTPHRTIRVEGYLWDPFGEATARAGEHDRSSVLREFIAWYIHTPGAKMPKRPPAPRGAESDSSA
jgi:hypothetical protein